MSLNHLFYRSSPGLASIQELDASIGAVTDETATLNETPQETHHGAPRSPFGDIPEFSFPAEVNWTSWRSRNTLEIPKMGSIEDLKVFVDRIHAIGCNDETGNQGLVAMCHTPWSTAQRYDPAFIHAKHRAIVNAANQLLEATDDEATLYATHAIKFDALHADRFEDAVSAAEFEAYLLELHHHPVNRFRAIAVGHLITKSVIHASLTKRDTAKRQELIEKILVYYDQFGVDHVTAGISEMVTRTIGEWDSPHGLHKLFDGLATRFEAAFSRSTRIATLATKYRKLAEQADRF